MSLAPRVWVVAGLFALALGGLFAPGLAGMLGTYVWLGVFPGLAVVRLLAPGARPEIRWPLGLALSPLVASLAGRALLLAGLPLLEGARIIGIASWLLWAGGEARAARRDDDADTVSLRFPWGWSLAVAAYCALPVVANAWIRIRSDSWVHGALVWEIVQHGVPPVDPRFAGMPLNYVWFFNLFIAQLTAFREQDAFIFMSIFNVVNAATLVWVFWSLARELWHDERDATSATLFLTVGLNAGAWLLWPLKLLTALRGDVRGAAEVRRLVSQVHPGSTDVLYVLQAPFAHMVNFWDKFTLGTPLGYAYLLALVALLALARWLSTRDPRALLLTGLAAAGMVLFHGVVGLSVVPVALGAVAVIAAARGRWDWLPPRGPLLAWGLALAAGFVVCMPYTRSISKGWSAESSGLAHSFLHFGWEMPWTIATACGVALVLLPAGCRRIEPERRGLVAWVAAFALGMAAFALVVHLPESNEHKFVWPLFAALALVAGPAWIPALDRLATRAGTFARWAVVVLVFLVPLLAFQFGYLADPMRHQAPALALSAGESALYEAIRRSPRDAVYIDHHSRDLINVLGRRRLLAGTTFGPERAAFPRADLERRRAISADLYGPVANWPADREGLADIVARARMRHSVSHVHVVYRAADHPGDAPWRRLEAARGGAAPWYDRDGFRIYELTEIR